jgi:hypothetical protein
VFQFWKLALFDCIHVSIATVMDVRVTLTLHHKWALAFTTNKPNIQFVSALLLHLNDHEFAASASGLDRYDAAMHDTEFTSLQGCTWQGVQAEDFVVCLPRDALRKPWAASVPEGDAQDDDDVVACVRGSRDSPKQSAQDGPCQTYPGIVDGRRR